VGLEEDSEEEEMEVEGQEDVTNEMNKVTWPETTLIQDNHGSLTAGKMATQLKTTHK
jgi:hypothetical protein